jgi:F420-dependent oxidoreductase-like protein
MRFGIFVPQGWRHDLVGIAPEDQWGVMRGLAQAADAGPWESIWVYDHLHTVPVPSEQATHEAWTLMAAFAAATSRVRLGQMCTCISYRNPAYLAKVAATVDIISGGRTEMGIGGGWYEHEWRAYGYGFPPAKERLGRLREGVEIMHQAWTGGYATLNGTYYQVDGARVWPKPLQENGIPLWIAGGGEKVTLRIAARYAQYTNFGGDLETFAHKSDVLRAHCADVGTDFDAIVRSANFNTIVGETEAEVRERIDALEARVLPYFGADRTAQAMAEYRSGKAVAVGTPEQVVERLRAFGDLGLGYSIHNFFESAYDRSGVELFEREVIPALT